MNPASVPSLKNPIRSPPRPPQLAQGLLARRHVAHHRAAVRRQDVERRGDDLGDLLGRVLDAAHGRVELAPGADPADLQAVEDVRVAVHDALELRDVREDLRQVGSPQARRVLLVGEAQQELDALRARPVEVGLQGGELSFGDLRLAVARQVAVGLRHRDAVPPIARERPVVRSAPGGIPRLKPDQGLKPPPALGVRHARQRHVARAGRPPDSNRQKGANGPGHTISHHFFPFLKAALTARPPPARAPPCRGKSRRSRTEPGASQARA